MNAFMSVVPIASSMHRLLDEYDGILLDAYGVLVDVSGPLPGAGALVALMNETKKPYAVCSNDASRLPETYAARFRRAGLDIPAERITSAGQLLDAYFAEHALAGARVAVLGTADSVAFVTAAGGVVVPLGAGMEVDVLAVCDDDGFDFKEGLDAAVSAVARSVAADRPIRLVLPNPDLLYPKSASELGFTAGAVAGMIEAGIARKFPHREVRFDRLGKPQPALLLHARTKVLGALTSPRLVMVGDQVETDIAAARAAGMDSALVDGVSSWQYVLASAQAKQPDALAPTYLLSSVSPSRTPGAP
jgi:HAD superfamily hydrolase (TIGR01450 family)